MKDKDELKNSLTLDDVEQIVDYLGGEPIRKNDTLICKTICHDGDSHKLYYYENSHLFKCFTQCEENYFDLFELIIKVKDCNLYEAIQFVLSYFGLSFEENFFPERTELQDWQIFNSHKTKVKDSQNEITLKVYENNILKNLPFVRLGNWEDEGISAEVAYRRGIRYDAAAEGIVIPHYNIDGKLIGIRERTMVKDNEDFGKYRPAIFNRIMYNHPLSFALYNLNNSKEAIHIMQKAVIFESEKSCLMFASSFGLENDISVACCGSSISSYQFQLLLEAGAKEIIVAFDKQFQSVGDDEFKRWTKKLENFNKRFSPYMAVSFMFDKNNVLRII